MFWFAYFYILMVHLVSLAFGMAYLLHGMENWVLSDNFITIFAFGERVQHRWLWQIWTVDSWTVNWKKLVLPSFKAARSHIISFLGYITDFISVIFLVWETFVFRILLVCLSHSFYLLINVEQLSWRFAQNLKVELLFVTLQCHLKIGKYTFVSFYFFHPIWAN